MENADPVKTAMGREDFDPTAEVTRLKALSRGIGAVVLFLGTARDLSRGKRVRKLEFEEHPELAQGELARIADEARARFGLLGLTLVHRLGEIPAGENIVLIAAAAAHRAEAFEAARWCIEELKKRVPVWKKEVFEDGEAWVEGQGA